MIIWSYKLERLDLMANDGSAGVETDSTSWESRAGSSSPFRPLGIIPTSSASGRSISENPPGNCGWLAPCHGVVQPRLSDPGVPPDQHRWSCRHGYDSTSSWVSVAEPAESDAP